MSRYFIPKEFIFIQDTPSDLWVIKHACGYPSVDIFTTLNGNVEKMIPLEITHVSDSRCEISFTKPFSGFAKLVG